MAGNINLNVAFYDAGQYPPHAVHSEGHQDSMGLCLFLALAEKLAGDQQPDLLLLDDVVMSVDREHRKQIARLFRDSFSQTQLVITTHDRAWAKYLVPMGVVDASHAYEFRAWDVETGPTVANYESAWERMEQQLKNADVGGAAHSLRNHLEETFSDICDGLGARVRFRGSGDYQAGDLMDPAFEALKNQIRAGVRLADERGDATLTSRLKDLEDRRAAARTSIKVDEWSVSANVHFNELLALEPDEFRAVVGSYREGLAVFLCADCSGALELSFDGEGRPRAVTCICMKSTWSIS